MNKDQLEGKWKEMKGQVKENWADLTEDDLKEVEGNFDKLVGKIQEKYGKTKEQAKEEIDDFLNKQ